MFEFPAKGARPVWIASYPRSGNTFLRIILENVFRLPSYSIYFVEGADHRDPSAEALEDAPRLPRNWRDCLVHDADAPPVLVKTHDPPIDDSPAIFIGRDGRAAIHSYYHYHKKFAFEQPSLTEIIAGACQFGGWSDHYRAWHPKVRPNTLLLRYDELVGHPEETILRLAEFLKLKPGQVRLPPFEELQKRLPAFFRRGQNTDYLHEWSPAHLALFNELHATAMEDLGFPILPSSESAAGTVKELAQSAARLHRLYLEQLGSVGRTFVSHQQEVQRLNGQIQELSGQVQNTLKPLLKTRWVRIGLALGAVSGPTNQPGSQTEPVAGSAKQAQPIPNRRLKVSDESTQSSSPTLPPAPLSAPNEDSFARG